MPGPGRPSLYTEELAARICERLARGESLRSVCRDDDMPTEAAVRQWALDPDHPFSSQYARAREVGYLGMADDLAEIADGDGDPARDRLRVDTRKWLLSKMLPKVYGDKQQMEHTGADGGPVRMITEVRRVIVRPDPPNG